MTDRRPIQLNQVLDAFLGEGPSQAPERVLFGALDEVAATPQRRAPLTTWRFSMPAPVRLGLVGAMLIAALVAVAIFVGSNRPNLPTPSTSPSPVASTTPSASPSPGATAAATPLPTPVISAISLSNSALNRVDSAVTAAQRPTELTTEDQGQLFRLSDSVRVWLDLNDLAAAVAEYAALSARATELAAKITPEHSARLLGAVAALGRILESAALPGGDLAAGTYFSTTFKPVVVVTLPGGWSRFLEDREVVALRKGDLTLAFDHTAPSVSADNVAKAVNLASAADLPTPPEAVTIGRFSGFAGYSVSGGSLWYDDASRVYDNPEGHEIRVWVLDIGGRTLTIHLDGTPEDLTASTAEVDALIASLESE